MTEDDRTSIAGAAPTGATGRLVGALSDPNHRFDPDQVVYLMAAAARWAREEGADRAYRAGQREAEQRISELNLAAIATGTRAHAFSELELRREGYRRTARQEWDTAAGWPWRGDHPGGPVPVWPAERDEPTPDRGAAR